ncbi:MAG: trigger factor [Actinomycetia bacterium]|nr:trigger factor [Actinomycetes bacterium]
MDTTLETLDGDRVKLTVAVDETEFDVAVDAAFKRIAKEIRLPGFRPGKAPRKLLEARIGVAAGRQEALQQALPDYYGRALAENEVDAIDQPEIEITGGAEDGPLTFDAVVPVRPRAAVAGHGSLRVEIQAIEASDDDVTEQLDAIRRQHATLADTDRPADDGDQVTIDIEGSVDDEVVEGLTTSDYLYEVGAGAVVPEIDENLRGASAGDALEFDADHPEEDDATLSFRIEVKAVQTRVLPDADDAFAAEASEFETIEELTADLRDRITTMRRGQAGMTARDRTAQALADLIDMEIPPTLVESEIDGRINDMAMRMSSQGIDFATYMEAMGRDLATMRDELREGAEIAARVDLGLRAVADAESLSGEGEALDEYLQLLAEQTGGDVDGIRKALTSSGRMLEVKADIRKQAALEWVFERASIVDEEGNEVDRALLEPPKPVDEPEMAIPAADDEVGETSDPTPDGDEEE